MIKLNPNRSFIIPALFVLSLALLASCKKDIVEKLVVVHDTVAPVSHDTLSPIRPVTATSNAYVTALFEYKPTPGQFINTDLGNQKGAEGVLKGNQGLVSLGAYGGYIVLGFDHTVLNVPNSNDFIVFGNAFNLFAEPGVIWVMDDKNGNGKPDDTWYELKGSQYGHDGYIRNYEVTYTRPAADTSDIPWKDNMGGTGFVKRNIYNQQTTYFPEWVNAKEFTVTGSLLPSTNIDDSNPEYIISRSFDFGYADNTAGGDKVDISNAIDKNGNRVKLKGIDFIKVQTGVLYDMGWLGEQSTEVCGAADLSMVKLDQ
ncbi:cell surface protein [Mucilaginibacter sp. SP1R1]|uniref:cell surface protein n=1 Tax=Mucilaginibacter sp. SP1R1 TaxID=2723091 RepID=UPI00160AA909|nr:cell surface protein [Mucilaginibacter sp. SP1R1]MBB6149888.1 hypothetical protein [Mucilaginibacter sp. SP1R1]